MISVEYLWNRVRDLSRKDKSAWTSNDEFNRDLAEAQDMMMDFYIGASGTGGRAREGVNTFIKQNQRIQPDQYPSYFLPDNYRQHFDCAVTPYGETKMYRADFYNSHQALISEESPIRRSSMAKKQFKYQVNAGRVTIFPREFVGHVYLSYFENPPEAKRAVTIENGEEVYDPLNTIDLAWGQSETHNFVDLLLYMKGIAIRESALLEFVQQKKAPGLVPEGLRAESTRRF